MKISFDQIIVLFIIITLLYSCNKNDAELTFGEKYINGRTSLTLVDTFSVEFSTIKLDSIQTSNTNTILVGHSHDGFFGDISCTSFLELTPPINYEIGNHDVYDSAALILNYTSYYGDTTQQFSITVHQLTERIGSEYDLYNSSSVNYNSIGIGRKEFFPQPFSNDSLLTIKLNDSIGSYLFNGLKDNNEDITMSDNFLETFKGLAIVGNNYNNNTILGFIAENVSLRLYLHESTAYDNTKYFDFSINSILNQFNKIEYDYSETLLKSIKTQEDELKSEDANGFSFIQAGTTLATKVKFPYLDELLLNNEGLILKANLIFVPKKLSYVRNDLPTGLILYKIGKHNVIKDILYANDGTTIITSNLVEDDLFQENTTYSFDISSYILNGLENHYFNPDDALLISFNSSDLNTNFNKVLIDTWEFTPQLRLYLLKY